MTKISFSDLPLIIRVATGLSFMGSWVIFEETIVDRHGLWKYMPLYKVGDLCTWDLTVAIVIVSTVTWLSMKRRRT